MVSAYVPGKVRCLLNTGLLCHFVLVRSGTGGRTCMRCLGHAPPLRAFVVVAWLLVIFPASSPGQSRHFHGAPGVASRSAEVDWTGLRAAEDGGGHLRSGAGPRPRRQIGRASCRERV